MCDCEMPKVQEDSEPRARREHRCELCCDPIKVGAKHRRVTVLGDGWQTYRYHLGCYLLVEEVEDALSGGGDYCYPLCGSEVWEAAHEMEIASFWWPSLDQRRAAGRPS